MAGSGWRSALCSWSSFLAAQSPSERLGHGHPPQRPASAFVDGAAFAPPGLATLSAYNAKQPPKAAADGGAPQRATAAEQLKPYANTCGLFALAPSEMGRLGEYRRAIAAAAAQHPPAYD